MSPVRLSDATGRAWAYACGRCHRVHGEGFGQPEKLLSPRALEAERCCRCHNCGKPFDRAGTVGYCGTECADVAYARDEAERRR